MDPESVALLIADTLRRLLDVQETVSVALSSGPLLLAVLSPLATRALPWERIRFLMGRSPLPDYGVYLDSAYPFTGHNREMTVGEVRLLLEDAGFEIERLMCYDYTPTRTMSIKGRLLRAAKRVLPGNFGESILALARPVPTAHEQNEPSHGG